MQPRSLCNNQDIRHFLPSSIIFVFYFLFSVQLISASCQLFILARRKNRGSTALSSISSVNEPRKPRFLASGEARHCSLKQINITNSAALQEGHGKDEDTYCARSSSSASTYLLSQSSSDICARVYTNNLNKLFPKVNKSNNKKKKNKSNNVHQGGKYH